MSRHSLIVFFCGVLLTAAGPLGAAERNRFMPSADYLTESLDDFQKSVISLEQANAEFSDYNGKLRNYVQQGKTALESLKQDHAQLEKEAEGYGSKTQKQSEELKTFESKVTELNNRIENVDQSLAAKQEAEGARLVRQKVIWDQLAAVNARGLSDLKESNSAEAARLVTEKVELEGELEDRLSKLKNLEEEIAYQSLLRMDPALSVPKLAGQLDKKKAELAALSPKTQSAKPPVNKGEVAKLKAEVGQLAKLRSERANLLQILHLQYDKSGNKSPRSAYSEKKLQEGLAALKKENKLLRQQAADFRFEMIDLDKRKTALEKEVQAYR